MEDLFSVENGILRFPAGFRFKPTDEELVLHYLKPKIQSLPLPLQIPEADVFRSDPWTLPCDHVLQETYFFSLSNNLPSHRTAMSGFWEDTGFENQVVDSRNQQVVGAKKTFVFFIGQPQKRNETDWILHEYKLGDSIQGVDHWVLCRVFLKKIDIDFEQNMEGDSSSSGSSGVTNVDGDEDEDGDEIEDENEDEEGEVNKQY